MVVLKILWRRYLLSNSEVKWHDEWQRNVYMPIISDEVFSCYNKNISRNHNLCIQLFYDPSEIIIYIFTGYFIKSNTKFKMCVRIIVFIHTHGRRWREKTGYVVRFILKYNDQEDNTDS